MKIRLITTVMGSLLGLWLAASYLAPATVDHGPDRLSADAHRLGPVVGEVAGLPEREVDVAPVNLFLLLTKDEGESLAVR